MRHIGTDQRRKPDSRREQWPATIRNYSKSFLLIVTSVLLLCASAAVAAPSFTATLDRNTVPLGETVTLSLILEGLTPNGAPPLPPLQNITVAPGVSQSQEYSFLNGQQTSKLTYSYTLVPTQPGNLVIPSMQVQAGGRTLASQPL